MSVHAEKGGHFSRRFELPIVPLAVAKAESVKRETLPLRDRRGGGGVETAAEKNHRLLFCHCGD
jgi:hypothetical protein